METGPPICSFDPAPISLGVDSLSILFNHRSFQKPAVSPGCLMVSGKERSLERMELEGTPRIRGEIYRLGRDQWTKVSPAEVQAHLWHRVHRTTQNQRPGTPRASLRLGFFSLALPGFELLGVHGGEAFGPTRLIGGGGFPHKAASFLGMVGSGIHSPASLLGQRM